MNERTHFDLFSGIGGFALAAQWNGLRTIGFCERDEYCQHVLRKHWPDVPIHGDIKQLDGRQYAGVDLLTGGYPCQPFSTAGKRRGTEDDRHLWPQMLRIIQECHPSWVIGENVAGHINMGLEQVCLDLEGEGYEVQPFVIPACAVCAPHRRARVWIIANRKCVRESQSQGSQQNQRGWISNSGTDASNTSSTGLQDGGCARITEESAQSGSRMVTERQRCGEDATRADGAPGERAKLSSGVHTKYAYDWGADWPQVASELCRVDDGLSNRSHRLKSLGNSIVPHVAAEIIKAIYWSK